MIIRKASKVTKLLRATSFDQNWPKTGRLKNIQKSEKNARLLNVKYQDEGHHGTARRDITFKKNRLEGPLGSKKIIR
jgi:hypothetical protein